MSLTIINRRNTEYKKIVENFVKFLMEKFKIGDNKEINVVLTNDNEILDLNKRFKQKNTPTNVLSFYGYDDDKILGDIVISIDTIQREAKEENKDPLEYLLFIVAHGVLHLLGYTHETTEKFDKMIKIQDDLVLEFFKTEEVEP